MAVKGSGLGKGPDPAMVDQAHYDARSGAAKRAQTSFPIHPGMTDRIKGPQAGPSSPGSGPDASSSNPLDPETAAQRGKRLRRQPGAMLPGGGSWEPGTLKSSWGMTDANGKGVDNSIGGKVLSEAILSGSTTLPASVSTKTGSGKAPSPYPSQDTGG